ncbi:hypothetical protein, partial [Stenotrophomonas maltophilia]|uniref:hypothetical protein n=1 Tax=Stenotrophomonas maltophilia TaxID=40324 RepID=UPI0039C13176
PQTQIRIFEWISEVCSAERRGNQAADTPPAPTHPASDRFLRGQPRKAEQKIKSRSRSLRS